MVGLSILLHLIFFNYFFFLEGASPSVSDGENHEEENEQPKTFKDLVSLLSYLKYC